MAFVQSYLNDLYYKSKTWLISIATVWVFKCHQSYQH